MSDGGAILSLGRLELDVLKWAWGVGNHTYETLDPRREWAWVLALLKELEEPK